MALIPPFFLDCVVAIGTQNKDGNKQWIGTGFLFGQFKRQRSAQEKDYKVYLVTNKHVLNNQASLMLRFNPQSEQPATDYPLLLQSKEGRNLWTGHPTDAVDVAVVPINAKRLQQEGMKFSFFQSDGNIFTKQKLKDLGTTEGDSIFILGFPMGLMATDRQYVLLRSGAISRIRDLYEGRSSDYVIDAFVFPGNSGGPVILKPEMISIDGTKANKSAALIGVVKSYIPYRDVALSKQTGRTRIIFEDNSGLSLVEPVDAILETIAVEERKVKSSNGTK